jgi:DNA repair exonuclease SbcCD ATPase subunit
MKLKLLKLVLHNFRHFENRTEFIFSDNTLISGANRTGKSTIAMAFSYLLYNKSPDNRSHFDIKNSKKRHLNKFDHIVEGEFLVDDTTPMSLKKVYKEVYAIDATGEKRLSQHTTLYYYNNKNKTQTEYESILSAIINKDIVPIVTDPLKFNTIEWTTRRNILSVMANIPSDNELASRWPEMWSARNNMDIYDFKANTAKEISDIEESMAVEEIKLQEIQTIISSFNADESAKTEIEALEKQKEAIMAGISDLNAKYSYLSKSNIEKNAKKEKLTKEIAIKRDMLRADYTLKEKELRDEINLKHSIKRRISSKLQSLELSNEDSENYNKMLKDVISSKNILLQELRDKHAKTKSEVFSEAASIARVCDRCGADLKEEVINKSLQDKIMEFEAKKEAKLKDIEQIGISLSEEIRGLVPRILDSAGIESEKNNIKLIEIEIANAQKLLDGLTIPSDTKEIQMLIDESDSIVFDTIDSVDTSELDEVTKKIIDLSAPFKMTAELVSKREFKENYIKELAIKKASLSKILSDINAFIYYKVSLIEESVNKHFGDGIYIKMFRDLINGNKEECCIVTYDDVQFIELNTADKINLGLKLINVLSAFYNLYLPIFVDNVESINEVSSVNTQIIKLSVNQSNLKVSNNE